MSSWSSSRRLAASVGLDEVKPVTLRVGRDMLAVRPVAIGSTMTVITIGMLDVAAAKASAAVAVAPIKTSGLVATSSRASLANRLRSPSAARISYAMLRPSK
jgi:hypothetical protein